MPADLPPNVDLEQHLQAGTALQGNYFYETTVNVEDRVKQTVEKFTDDLRVEMNEHGKYTIVVVNEPEAVNYSPNQSNVESYISYIKDQTIETHLHNGHNHEEANALSTKQLESLNHVRGQHFKLANKELPENINYMTKMASNALATNQSSSAHMSFRQHGAMIDMHDDVTQSPEKSFGYINYDFATDKHIHQEIALGEITQNIESLHIEGYTLEDSAKRTLNHELGHQLSHFHSDYPFSTQGSETMADILEVAFSAADGNVTQEEIDYRILVRSYAFGQGGAEHYSVSSVKKFLEVTDLSEFKGLTKDEISQAVVERQDEYMSSEKERHYQYDMDTLERDDSTRSVKLIGGKDVPKNEFEGMHQFSFVNEHKNTYEPSLPEGVLSPKQAHLLMQNEEFVEFAKSNDTHLSVIQDIADRAYLITTEEDITLGLDQIEYEKPAIFYEDIKHENQRIEQSTYPYDLSDDAQQNMTDSEIAYATYHNEVTSHIWRDQETLEDHNLAPKERAHMLGKYKRTSAQEGYIPPENLTLDDIESIHTTHYQAIAQQRKIELENPITFIHVGPRMPDKSEKDTHDR